MTSGEVGVSFPDVFDLCDLEGQIIFCLSCIAETTHCYSSCYAVVATAVVLAAVAIVTTAIATTAVFAVDGQFVFEDGFYLVFVSDV